MKQQKLLRKWCFMFGNLTARRRVALSMGIVGAFLLLFFLLIFTYSFPGNTPAILLVLVSYHFEFMLFMVGLGVAVGAASFYLMHEEVEVRGNESRGNAELALSLLNGDERKTVKLLLDGDGECLQAEVARLDGMTRLKAHRVAQGLSKRGVVILERRGKAIVLKLDENIRNALSG